MVNYIANPWANYKTFPVNGGFNSKTFPLKSLPVHTYMIISCKNTISVKYGGAK